MSEAEVWVVGNATPATSSSPPTKGASFILILVCSFFAVFFGTLFLLRILLSLYRMLGRLIWGQRVTNSASSGLSAKKKTEIDTLREVAIRRYLKDYTRTHECNDANGLSAIEQSTKLTVAQQEPKDEMTIDHCEEPKEETKIDIDEELANEKSRDEYTEKCTLLESSTSTSESDSSLSKNESLQQSSNHSYEKLECVMHDNEHDDNELHCTICHEVYEPSDRICHSSNSDCIHIFHEECIVHWLVSLGWMKLKEKHMNERMMKDKKELMNYELECPCCRQDFIDKSLFDDLEQEEKADEKV